MSYILDALKKSDQQRNLGTPPTLQFAQATMPAPKRPSLFYYGLLAVVLLGAGVAIGLLRPWQAAANALRDRAHCPSITGQDSFTGRTANDDSIT